MKLSKVFHVASVISGVLGILGLFGAWGGGMVGGQGYMSMPIGSIALILIAIWLQLATMHHMMLEKKGEII